MFNSVEHVKKNWLLIKNIFFLFVLKYKIIFLELSYYKLLLEMIWHRRLMFGEEVTFTRPHGISVRLVGGWKSGWHGGVWVHVFGSIFFGYHSRRPSERLLALINKKLWVGNVKLGRSWTAMLVFACRQRLYCLYSLCKKHDCDPALLIFRMQLQLCSKQTT